MKDSVEVNNLLNKAKVLFCVSGDPWLQPQGGQGTFARHILSALKADLAVVSPCPHSLPVGQWVARDFEGTQIAFFNLGFLRREGTTKKPLIPAGSPFCIWLPGAWVPSTVRGFKTSSSMILNY